MSKNKWLVIGIIYLLSITQIYAKSLPSDEIYRTSTNSKSIEVISSDEVEIRNGNDIIIGSYSFKRDSLRIVYSMFGAKNVQYFDFMPEGLVDNKGVIFYSTAQYKILQKEILKEEERQRHIEEEKLRAKQEAEEKRKQEKRKRNLEKKFCRASAKGDIETMQSLLDKGVDINASCYAIDKATLNKQLGSIRFLIKHGIDANGKDGKTLQYCISNGKKDMVKLLLENGANPNYYTRYTPLQISIIYNHTKIAKMLYKYGAKIDAKDHEGNTALDTAIDTKNIELFRIFINEQNLKSYTKSRAFKTLVESYNGRFNYKTTHTILKKEMLDALINKKINSCEAINSAFLTYYTAGGSGARQTENNLIKFITKLFPYCHDINCKVTLNDMKGKKSSLLFSLVYSNTLILNVMKILLDKGANINFKDELGETPLHLAVRKWNNSKVIELLIKNGANIYAEDNKGQTPIDIALNNYKGLLERLSKSKEAIQIVKVKPSIKNDNNTTKINENSKILNQAKEKARPSVPENTQESLKVDIENKYTIVFNVAPSDAKVDITNIKDIFYQGISLKKGKYYVEISKEGYKTYKNSYELIKDASFDIVLEKEKIEQGNTNLIPNASLQTLSQNTDFTDRYLTDIELQNKSAWELKVMRNKIFARYGYIFKTSKMRNYFQQQSWYEPKFNNVDHLLTDIDRENIAKIQQYEH